MGEFRQLHCMHCGQTLLSDDLEKCSACGKIGGMRDPADAAALRDFVARKQAESGPMATDEDLKQVLKTWVTIRWVLGGLVIIALGVLLMVAPDLRSDPQRLSLKDVAYGFVVILVGVAALARPFLRFPWGFQPSEKDKDQGNQDNYPEGVA